MSQDSQFPTPNLTVPVAPEIAPQLVSFEPVKKSFCLHNAKPKPVETMYSGHMMTVPAVHQIHGMQRDGKLASWSKAETDPEGKPIPGTYVVEDIYTWSPTIGANVLTMDAERAVITILKIERNPEGKASQLTSAWAMSGLSLLPRHPPREMWEVVSKAGEQRAFLAAVKTAEYEIEAFEKKNALRKENGLPAVSGGPLIQYSIQLVNQYNALVNREADQRMAPYKEEAMVREAEDDLEFSVYLKATVNELVEKTAQKRAVNKLELFEELVRDPQIRSQIQKKYRFRKRGHLDVGEREKE